MILSLLFSILAGLVCFPTQVFAETKAQSYERFVDEFIPFSHNLAQNDAKLREQAVFTQRLSDAQMILSNAYKAYLELEDLIQESKALNSESQNFEDEKEIRSRIDLNSAILGTLNKIENQIIEFKKAKTSFDTACSDEASFNAYQAENLNTHLAIIDPPSVDFLDGVYLSLGNPVEGVVSLAKSVVALFNNNSETESIRKAEKKLRSQSVSTTEYRKYAKQSCQELAQRFNSTFLAYSAVIEKLEGIVNKINTESYIQENQRLFGKLNQIKLRKRDERIREILGENHDF